MGKLKDLWALYKTFEEGDPRKQEIQQEINKIEQYCIDKGYVGFSITKWGKEGTSDNYPLNTGYLFVEDISKVYIDEEV